MLPRDLLPDVLLFGLLARKIFRGLLGAPVLRFGCLLALILVLSAGRQPRARKAGMIEECHGVRLFWLRGRMPPVHGAPRTGFDLAVV